MKKLKQYGWVYYLADEVDLDPDKTGKWMCFFSDVSLISEICEKAVSNNIVVESKHRDGDDGVACFYLNHDDTEAHKRTIQYFLDNNLIKVTKAGKLYNITFKLDAQTRAGEYGDDYQSDIKLSDFLDLSTREWRY